MAEEFQQYTSVLFLPKESFAFSVSLKYQGNLKFSEARVRLVKASLGV